MPTDWQRRLRYLTLLASVKTTAATLGCRKKAIFIY